MTLSLLFWLGLSFLCTNFTNNALLYLQRHERKARISYHAASSLQAYLMYCVGHFFGGLFFGVFAYKMFFRLHPSTLALDLSVLGVALEWLQAFVPSWHRYKTPHWIFAWGMAGVMILLMVVAPFAVGLQNGGEVAIAFSVFALGVNTLIDKKATRERFWIAQSTLTLFFYVSMLLLIR